MKKFIVFFGILLFASCLNAQNLSIFVASSASKAMSEVKDEFLKTHPEDKIELVFGASGKYYELLKQGREFDLFFSADTKYAKAIYDNKNALIKPRVYVLGVLALYSLDENLLQGGVENLKEKAGKITHLSIAYPKVAPYGIAAKEVLENLDLNELFKDKIVLGENISVPVLHVDSKNSDIAIVAYSLVSPINHPKGKTSIINPKYFSPLEQSYVITKYAKDKKLAFEFSEFIGSSKAKEIFKKYGFSTP
ncbi:molybdate ABC transporter substrate-binding protein [Campylobacter jejuni]|uniref:Molybdate transport system substrate-binding protein n=1 Tax=Campylobacter jejuni TaxID=197 RepID=A0AAX2M0C8_CAMJU|nr:molybdate ABC transporter substrate-binding protein [Campylobacter jejuni]EAK7678225.1 molybdate ABC transporter substrate-binding protein [Campylobacter coli]AXL44707.1 molybdate-binding protein [Campylobacter jejuni]EAH7273717.1 molybdate ABC transporter substrate-binding protein [Campylobacter jejuni]EAH7563935.1 molybdate ABC transporter substrate-binding protein [Campylobacter jejuni]EAH7564328.1 molybdate ABC transporter substrate-binding protein [Campylobacter jejuni]